MELDLRNQNGLLLKNLLDFYKDKNNFNRLLNIVNGNSKISLRLIDWFSTNFSKKYYIIYSIPFHGAAAAAESPVEKNTILQNQRFQVYLEYKLNLKAFSKRRFDPFCRWDRITIPIPPSDDGATAAAAQQPTEVQQYFETTIGQLNFFKWAMTNYILDYIEQNFDKIEKDMNARNTISKKKSAGGGASSGGQDTQTRKKREQISVSATQTLKKENVNILIRFS
jgi:hypothetical protein